MFLAGSRSPGCPIGVSGTDGVENGFARDTGKEHMAAVICLAWRRCGVIYAMLRHGTSTKKPAHAA